MSVGRAKGRLARSRPLSQHVLERFRAKRIPVRVKKTHQSGNPEHVSIQSKRKSL